MIPPDVQKAIDKALKPGVNVKISLDRHGQYHVYEEKVKKVPLEGTTQP